MRRFLVVGGFEPSGHDSTAEAVIETGVKRGHQVDCLKWRDHIALADHPMFVSHREAAARGAPEIAGMLDESWIGDVLSADLADRIPLGYDGYVSVHPWSSKICGAALQDDPTPKLFDYHSDFGPFPVVVDDRIDAYLGGGRIRALNPRVRSRCHRVGVAVPRRFHHVPEPAARANRLIVSAGRDGWAVNAMQPAVRELASRLGPAEIILLAPSEEAQRSWAPMNIMGARTVTDCTDVSGCLKDARWYLSKGGGTAVAEGLAAGCLGFVAASGIFWEDEAAEHLHAKGVVADANSPNPSSQFQPGNVEAARAECIGAADALWKVVEQGGPAHSNELELTILTELSKRVAGLGDNPLPRTTDVLRQRLAAWRDEWKGSRP